MSSKILQKPRSDITNDITFHYPISRWNYTPSFKARFRPKEDKKFKYISTINAGIHILDLMILHNSSNYTKPFRFYALTNNKSFPHTNFKRMSFKNNIIGRR